MVKKGYVERFHSEIDRRSVLVNLTAEGKKLKQAFSKTRVSNLDDDMLDVSAADLRKVLRILNQIRQRALEELSEK